MSRILKRPMFRKGGEVMEGVMTGIKPRKMFSTAGIVDDVRRKVSLIDSISGPSSPLGAPLTQFLLETGQNLIGGQSAGGTKLQEIVGATKDPLARAIKSQQLKDLQKRKLVTSLIAKSKVGGAEQAWKEYGQYSGMSKDDFIKQYSKTQLFKKETSPGEKAYMEGKELRKDLGSIKGFTGKKKYSEVEKSIIADAVPKITGNENLLDIIDKQNPYYQGSDYEKGKKVKIKQGTETVEVETLVPNDKSDFTANKAYFIIEENKFYIFDGAKLIPLLGV